MHEMREQMQLGQHRFVFDCGQVAGCIGHEPPRHPGAMQRNADAAAEPEFPGFTEHVADFLQMRIDDPAVVELRFVPCERDRVM